MKYKTFKHNSIMILGVLFALLVGILLFQSGKFSRSPIVEAHADNCYCETLNVVTYEDYRPYSFHDANGSYAGYDVELITHNLRHE